MSCEDNPDAFIASEDIPKVKGAGMNSDGVHLSQQGYNLIGEKSAIAVDAILNGDKGKEASPTTERRGIINMPGQQEWVMHGAWINKVGSNWNLDPSLSRAVSMITSVTDDQVSDYLLVKIPTDLSYVLSATGGNFATLSGQDFRIVFDWSMYEDRDSEGLTVAKMYFFADSQVFVDTAAQTAVYNPGNNLNLYKVVSASGWGGGQVKLTHPLSKGCASVQGNSAGVFLYSVDPQTAPITTTTIRCVNAANEARNSKFTVNIPNMLIPPRCLPEGTQIFFNILGARKIIL
ncbi:hypothetical protein ACOZ06_002079 [Cronobacter muytjensii]